MLNIGTTAAGEPFTLPPEDLDDLARRLWEKVNKPPGPDVCWEWTGYLRNGHHGSLWYRGGNLYVHRLSYVLHRGPIPAGMVVCHTCDNPPCVRPDHLSLGTQADNVADMEVKGRDRKVGPTGVRNGNADLTSAEVAEIRRLVAGGMKQRDVAARFGCSQSTVWRIVHEITREDG